MLKQLAVHQKVFGAIILLFAWSLFIKQAAADEWNGTIAFLSDRGRDSLFQTAVYLVANLCRSARL